MVALVVREGVGGGGQGGCGVSVLKVRGHREKRGGQG